MENIMKETNKKPRVKDEELQKDLTEMKITIAIMQKQIAKLEEKLQEKDNVISAEDWHELLSMNNNRKI